MNKDDFLGAASSVAWFRHRAVSRPSLSRDNLCLTLPYREALELIAYLDVDADFCPVQFIDYKYYVGNCWVCAGAHGVDFYIAKQKPKNNVQDDNAAEHY